MFTEWNFTKRNQNFGLKFEIILKVNMKKVCANQNTVWAGLGWPPAGIRSLAANICIEQRTEAEQLGVLGPSQHNMWIRYQQYVVKTSDGLLCKW